MQQVDIFLTISTKAPSTKKASYKYILACNGHTLTGTGDLTNTTGHRLVMTCAIEALKRMKKPAMITIHTDCRYLINGHRNLQIWKEAGWTRATGELKNADLWQQLFELQKGHAVRYRYENMESYKE